MIEDTESLFAGLDAGTVSLRRLEALRRLGSFDGRAVLNLGCGAGDFYRYLKAKGEAPAYTGVDWRPEMIEEGHRRFASDQRCRFELGDVLSYQPAAAFDFVVASGLFDFKTCASGSIVTDALSRLFSWCAAGMAVNFSRERGMARAGRGFILEPSSIVRIALRLTPSIRLAHDYLPDDFTVYLYRPPSAPKTSLKEPADELKD